MKSDHVINFLQFILGMFLNLAIVAVVGYAVYAFAIWGFNFGVGMAYDMVYVGEDYEYIFVLEEDTPAAEVSLMLEERGIINSSRLFNLELFLMGRVRTYEAGTYRLNRSMSNTEVHQILRGSMIGYAPHDTITVLEGWTILDMANYFEERGFFTADEFIYVATYGHFGFNFLLDVPERPNGLEGYLFPDTYQIPVNPTPGDIIWRMLNRFDEVFDGEMHAQAIEMGLTLDEVVIMASIVEREARLASERPIISQVIHNRIAINMRLQMCSTVSYVLYREYGIHRERLLYVDLEIVSPYNTYMYPGLPIGPIANPGAASLRAVLNPSGDDYLFFALYDAETGAHFFSRTPEEHHAADQRARARGV